jgi:Na+-transporting methylmalonyl-CoA/oxaloacetate decarboxylase gamma subunit
MSRRSPCLSFTGSSAGYLFIVILVIVFCVAPGAAQTAQPTPTPLPLEATNDFHPLFNERERLIEEIKRLEQVIEELAEEVSDIPPRAHLERELTRLKGELEKEQKAPTPDQAKLAAIQGYIDDTTEKLDTLKGASELQKKKDDAYVLRRRQTQVEQKIAALFDDKRDVSLFRAISTAIMGVLIAIVVGGFYVIAWYKDGIATKIFGGEMGMQFVTLFLIVIAIILFGIMGTLEGRELAALLGGLSGYILGKASFKSDETKNDRAPAQGQAQQNQQQVQNQNQPNEDQG